MKHELKENLGMTVILGLVIAYLVNPQLVAGTIYGAFLWIFGAN